MKFLAFSLALLGVLALSAPAHAEGPYEIILKNSQFSPPQLEIPANQKVKIIVKNQDPKSAEIESQDFTLEKIIAPNSEAKIFVGPLEPGTYNYFDEFNPSSTGTLTVK